MYIMEIINLITGSSQVDTENKVKVIEDKIKAIDGKCECYSCKEVKPLEEFCRDRRRVTGRTTVCLSCERIRGRARYKRHGG